jgi:hypothetical protein
MEAVEPIQVTRVRAVVQMVVLVAEEAISSRVHAQ